MCIKNIVFILLLLSLWQPVFAQVHGRFADSAGHNPAYATVQLLRTGGTTGALKRSFTNDSGYFSFDSISKGRYQISFSGTGFAPMLTPPFNFEGSLNLGTILLTDDKTRLASITVRTETPTMRQVQGGIAVNVENSILSRGSSALDVLERSPGVSVDRRNTEVALNGKGGVAVMVDGKLLNLPPEQLLHFLGSLSANDIASVEVLTTPPAGYDAEGTGGLINIVLKKNRKPGDYGNLSLTAGYGVGEKGAVGLSLTHNTSKLQISGSYNFSHDNSYYSWQAKASQNIPLLGGPNTSDIKSVTSPVNNSHTLTAGIEATLPHQVTAGINVSYGNSLTASTVVNNGYYIVEPDSLLLLHVDTRGRNSWNNFISSLYAAKKINGKHTISADLDMLLYGNENPTAAQTVFTNKYGTPAGTGEGLFGPQQQGYAHTNIRVGVAKADYTGILTGLLTVNAGLKISYTNSTSQAGIKVMQNGNWVEANQATNNIVMRESIGASYLSLNVKMGTNRRLVIGGRYEYTCTDIQNRDSGESIVKRRRGELFPNLSFSQKFSTGGELQVSYTKRISRPAYNDLASFIIYDGPTSANTGNPLLQATISTSLRAAYVYRGYSLGLIYSNDKNPIVRYQIVASPSGNITLVSPQNLLYLNSLNLQAFLPVRVNKWWQMQYSFTGGIRSFKEEYTKYPAGKDYWAYTLNSTQTFRLRGGYGIELSGYFNSLYYNGTRKTKGYGVMNAGVKKQLAKNGGTIQLSVADIFSSLRITSYFGALTQEALALKSQVLGINESGRFPVIKLSYTRSFGKAQQHAAGNDRAADEKERVRQ